ncbi:MAG TPA: hypothetical protein PLO56_10890 [Rhodothermales bacterium]|nr:hypothetical protein [Rhodothermales bacterium]
MKTKFIRGLSLFVILLGASFLSFQPAISSVAAECTISKSCGDGITISCKAANGGECRSFGDCLVCKDSGPEVRACCE